MKAILKNYRQSPRKVRLVAKSVRGKSVTEAQNILHFMPKRAALPIKKLIDSAVANAKNSGADVSDLVVKNIEVNMGFTLKRIRPRARGSAFGIKKRTSHVVVTLAAKNASKSEPKKAEVIEKKAEKKPAVKKPAAKKVAKPARPGKKAA